MGSGPVAAGGARGEAFTSCLRLSSEESPDFSTSGTRCASTTMCSDSTTEGPSSSSLLPLPLSPPGSSLATPSTACPTPYLMDHEFVLLAPLDLLGVFPIRRKRWTRICSQG